MANSNAEIAPVEARVSAAEQSTPASRLLLDRAEENIIDVHMRRRGQRIHHRRCHILSLAHVNPTVIGTHHGGTVILYCRRSNTCFD